MMRWVRAGAQVVVVAVLLAGVFVVGNLRDDVDNAEQDTDTVGEILSEACGAASLRELREQDLVAECRLAQQDRLTDQIPETPPKDPGSVVPDDNPLPDLPDPDPLIAIAVEDYFATHPLPVPQYERQIAAAVSVYLQANPPKPGRPPTDAEVAAAVRTVLLANPPTDGAGVAAATLDGCAVVFTFTDGTSDRVGPVCGPPGATGPPPTPAEVRSAVDAFCAANGCTGPPGPAGPPGVVSAEDACNPPDGDVVTDVGVTYNPDTQTVRITCTTAPAFPGGGGGGPG